MHLLMQFRKQNLKAPRQKLHLILAPQDRGSIITPTYLCSLQNLFRLALAMSLDVLQFLTMLSMTAFIVPVSPLLRNAPTPPPVVLFLFPHGNNYQEAIWFL